MREACIVVGKGEIYERVVRAHHLWRNERRLVLDATAGSVFYEVIYDEPEGTYVECDVAEHQKQVSMKRWLDWAKLARLTKP